jgi:hypothetical protein
MFMAVLELMALFVDDTVGSAGIEMHIVDIDGIARPRHSPQAWIELIPVRLRHCR